jgi:hypothetical protein
MMEILESSLSNSSNILQSSATILQKYSLYKILGNTRTKQKYNL